MTGRAAVAMGQVRRGAGAYRFAALIVFLVVLSFLPVVRNEFVNWDDPYSFTLNGNFRGLSLQHVRWMFTTLSTGHYQPLSWLTHALVYCVWGMNPIGYHLVNLLLHAINAVLVYALIARFLERRWSGVADRTPELYGAAAAGALFFALHPLRVEAVAWATERREVLCATFLLLTVLAYTRMQEAGSAPRSTWRTWYVVSVSCFALSLLSKATGLTLPVVLLVLDVYPFGRFAPEHGRPAALVAALKEKIPYAVLACAAAAVALLAVKPEAMVPLAEHGIMARTMQAAYGLCFYLWKTVAPFHLSPLYLREQPLDPSRARYVICLGAVVAITIGVILLRRRMPWALTAWVSYVLIVAPVLGFVQSGPQLVADRYTYLSCLPWAVLVAAGIRRLWLAAAPQRAGAMVQPALVAITAVILGGLGVLTRAQTRVWHDSLTLWNHVLRIEPQNYIAYDSLGYARQTDGDLDGALADYGRALRINSHFPNIYLNRGSARQAKGDWKGALADYDEALRLSPNYAEAFFHRGTARQATGDLSGALADFDSALRINPNYTDPYYAGPLR